MTRLHSRQLPMICQGFLFRVASKIKEVEAGRQDQFREIGITHHESRITEGTHGGQAEHH